MTTTTAPPTPDDGDEPTGPAAWAAKRYGRPAPTTTTPATPAEWRDRLFNTKENRR